MVKVLFLRLLVAMMCVLVSAIPAPKLVKRPDLLSSTSPSSPEPEDPATRSERSTNLSLNANRRIQLFIKNRHLQLLPDGTVNGTLNASSNYTVLQRTAVKVGQVKIQGVATCMYLCMDVCGFLYGSRDVTKECIFREKINEDNYNTYSSVKYSNSNKTMYVAMNRYGQMRKLILRGNADLGKLASYARALTTVPQSDIHPIRHEAHHCRDATGSDMPESTRPTKCPVGPKKKKKKKKRKCTAEHPCPKKNNKKVAERKCTIGEDGNEKGEKCVSRVSNQNSKGHLSGKRKQGPKGLAGQGKNGVKNKKKGKQLGGKKKGGGGGKRTTTTTELAAISTTTTEEPIDDDYYGFENSTQADWDEASTASVDESSTTTTMHPD